MKIILILIGFLPGFAWGGSTPKSDGSTFLKNYRAQAQPKSLSEAQIPQNFGGQGPKMLLDKQNELTQLARKISISDEAIFETAVQTFFNPFTKALESKTFDTSLFQSGDKAYSFDQKINPGKSLDQVLVQAWQVNGNDSSLDSVSKKMQSYLARFKSIEAVEVSPYRMKTLISERSKETWQPNFFTTSVKIDIRGKNTSDRLVNDRFELSMSIFREAGQKVWKARSMKLLSGETLSASNTSFSESKKIFAGTAPTSYLRKEAIRRGGYAVSVCDYNGDGQQDLIVGNLGRIELFKGGKNGTFQSVDLEKAGIGGETLVKSVACVDFDNDGQKDLLLIRFAPSEQAGNDIVLYRNTGSGFEKKTSIKNRQPAYYAMPTAVADFNNDSFLDFYVGFPGAKDFTVLNKTPSGFAGLKELHPQGLFYNDAQFAFREVTKESIPYTVTKNAYTDGYPESAAVFPHSSVALDYDLNGTMDIVVIDDKANLSPLYKNTGNGDFAQIADKIGVSNSDFGMGFTAADLDNDGYLEFIYTNVNFLPLERIQNGLAENFSEYGHIAGTYGLRIFKTKDGKNYSDVTAISGVTNPGYGLGGVEVIDYNNDGLPDIYVANGLWSGNSKEQDISSLFARSYLTNDFDYQETFDSSEGIANANTSFMKILTDFRGDVSTLTVDPKVAPSMTGYQHNRMYRNNGDGTFTEVGYLLGVDSSADGYIVATADLNKDGKMDLILRNADPGVREDQFKPVQIFMNNSPSKNRSVILSLQGTKSNRDAIGAIVEASIGGKKVVRHLISNNGAAQSQLALHFGLGNQKKIEMLKICWPSGNVDTIRNVLPGFHRYIENSVQLSSNSL